MNVLIFAPHPDDEVIGCGGSIARHVSQGAEVHVAYLTSGERAMSPLSISENGQNREREAAEAAKILGICQQHFLRFSDTHLEVTQHTVETVEALLRNVQPEWVYVTHALEALHDHVSAYKIVSKALGIAARRSRGFPSCLPRRVLAYEVWTPILVPNYVVPVSAYMHLKLAALRKYELELASRPYDQIAEGLALYRGLTLSTESYAEAFEILFLRD